MGYTRCSDQDLGQIGFSDVVVVIQFSVQCVEASYQAVVGV